MFSQTFYTLQAKKILWFATMTALAAYTLINAPLAPFTLLGLSLGIGAFHALPLLPTKSAIVFALLTAPLIALFTPIALTFNLAFLGSMGSVLLSNRIKGPHDISEVLINTHTMSHREEADLQLIKKLEKKTYIQVRDIEVCDVDDKNFAPNAAAVGGFLNNTIYVFSNFIESSFTPKEKKAVYAHEFGHLKYRDFLSVNATSFLWYTTIATSFLSFSLPIAIATSFVASLSFYAISQINELLADCYSAQHSNPTALISALDKLMDSRKEKPNTDNSLWEKAKSSFYAFEDKAGLSTHPSLELRKSYLASYAQEKQILKDRLRA